MSMTPTVVAILGQFMSCNVGQRFTRVIRDYKKERTYKVNVKLKKNHPEFNAHYVNETVQHF